MGTVLCKLLRYILCNIFVAYERGSKYILCFVSFRFVTLLLGEEINATDSYESAQTRA